MVVQTENIPACIPRRHLEPIKSRGKDMMMSGLQHSAPPPTDTHITSSRRTSSLLRISALSYWAFVALTAVSKIPVRLCWYKVVAGRTSSGLGQNNSDMIR